MRFTQILLTAFVFLSPLSLCANDKAINEFLKTASPQVKAELEPQLKQGLLGYNRPEFCNRCKLSEDAQNFILKNRNSLHTLELSHVNLNELSLTEVPPKFFLTPGLVEVSLESNLLKKLPLTLAFATSLTTLLLHDNLIEYVSGEIGNLPCLTYLDLSDNMLLELPDSLAKHKLPVREVLATRNNIDLSELTDDLFDALEATEFWLDNPEIITTKTIAVNPNPTTHVEKQIDKCGRKTIKVIKTQGEKENIEIIVSREKRPFPPTLLHLDRDDESDED